MANKFHNPKTVALAGKYSLGGEVPAGRARALRLGPGRPRFQGQAGATASRSSASSGLEEHRPGAEGGRHGLRRHRQDQRLPDRQPLHRGQPRGARPATSRAPFPASTLLIVSGPRRSRHAGRGRGRGAKQESHAKHCRLAVRPGVERRHAADPLVPGHLELIDRSVLKVALAQLNPKVGDVAGNLAKVRAARAEAAKQGADLVLTAELVLAGYFPEDLVLKPAFQKRCHEAVEALRADTRGRRAGAVRRHAVARGRQALQRHHLPRQRRDHRQALQGRPAELRRVRRQARLRARPDAGAAGLQGRAHRRADLRGRVDARRRRMHLRDRRRDPAGAQRLALRGRQDRRARAARRQARGRERPAAGLSQPGRRPGRGDLRRRLVRAGRRPHAQGQARLVPRGGGDHRVPPQRQRLGVPARPRSRPSSATSNRSTRR